MACHIICQSKILIIPLLDLTLVGMLAYIKSSMMCVGYFISLHGKTVGRIWCGNNILCGNVELFFIFLFLFFFSSLVLCKR